MNKSDRLWILFGICCVIVDAAFLGAFIQDALAHTLAHADDEHDRIAKETNDLLLLVED
jgi:hypothetical protein